MDFTYTETQDIRNAGHGPRHAVALFDRHI